MTGLLLQVRKYIRQIEVNPYHSIPAGLFQDYQYYTIEGSAMNLIDRIKKNFVQKYDRETVILGITHNSGMIRMDWAEDAECPVLQEYVSIGMADGVPLIRMLWVKKALEFSRDQLIVGVTDSNEDVRTVLAKKVSDSNMAIDGDIINIGLSDVKHISSIWMDIAKKQQDKLLHEEDVVTCHYSI